MGRVCCIVYGLLLLAFGFALPATHFLLNEEEKAITTYYLEVRHTHKYTIWSKLEKNHAFNLFGQRAFNFDRKTGGTN